MTETKLHQTRQWKEWIPTPELLAEAMDLIKNHPLSLWEKIKDGEKDDNLLKNVPLNEVHAIISNVLSKHFGEVDEIKRFYLYLSLRRVARTECGIVDEE